MQIPRMLLIMGQPGAGNADHKVILPMLRELGIDVTCCDYRQINATTGKLNGLDESDYDGCIFNAPNTYSGAMQRFFIPATAHPWPVLTLNTGASLFDLAAGSNVPGGFYSGVHHGGVSGGPGNGEVTAADKADNKLLVSHAANGFGDLAVQGSYMLSGDWDSGAPHYNYEIIAGYNDGAKVWPIIYRQTGGTADNIHNCYRSDYVGIGGIILASVGYYLHLLGLEAPNPVVIRLDMDDINDTPAVNCLAEFIAYLRTRRTRCTCGINPSYTTSYTPWLQSTSLALAKSADDVLDWIMHDHFGGAGQTYWDSDAGSWATIEGKLAAAEEGINSNGSANGKGRADVAEATGLGDRLRLFTEDGYAYFPNNNLTPLSVRALLSAGCTKFGIALTTTGIAPGVYNLSYPKGNDGPQATIQGRTVMTQGIYGTAVQSATTWAAIKNNAEDGAYAATWQHQVGLDKGRWGGVQRAMLHGPVLGVEGERKFIIDILRLTIDPLIAFSYGTVIRYWQPGD